MIALALSRILDVAEPVVEGLPTILPETVFRVSFEQRRRTLKFRTSFERYAPESNLGFDNGIGRASSLEQAVIGSLIGKSAQSSASAQHHETSRVVHR
jgi:hypothetical protein